MADHRIGPGRGGDTGFAALIAVLLLAAGTMAFSLATLDAAASYEDAASRRELRIQAGLNATACLDSVSLMLARDYFLNGTVSLPEFGCTAVLANPSGRGNVAVNVTAELSGVSMMQSRVLVLP